MNRVCVYCGSNDGRQPGYREAARAMGRELAARGIGLVYGGGGVGVMGALADEALERGGEVIGIIPKSMATREVAHGALSQLIVVGSMHERKARMESLSDGFIALPGGWGTFEEIFEMLTWAQLGLHAKPCGLLNVDGYYDHLFAFLQHAVEERFVRRQHQPMMMMDDDPASLLDRFRTYRAPRVPKWLGRKET